MVRPSVGLVLALALLGPGCDGGAAPVTEDKKAPAKAEPKPTPPKPTPTPDVDTPPARTLPKTLPKADAIAKAAEIHGKRRTSFFCSCSYTPAMRTIRQSCGYRTRADDSLAHDVVWTHVAPPDVFGAHRTCWTTEACTRPDGKPFGGIECCREKDPVFAAIEGDLHNLVPIIGEIAKDRSDHRFGEVKGEVRLYGACDIEVDDAAGVIEPPPKVRGDIARIYLYLRAAYGDEVVLPDEEWKLFEAWHAEDPPDAWELERAAAITQIQGVPHPLLAAPAGGAAPPPAAPAPDGKAPDGKAADGKAADGKAADGKAPAGKAPDAKAPAGGDKPASPPASPIDPSRTG